MNSIYVHGKTWFDKVNGNSYFSARVEIDGEEVARLPFQYGYGDQYLHEARKVLTEKGLIESRIGALWNLKDDGVSVYSVIESAKKSEVTGWGKPWEVTKWLTKQTADKLTLL